MEKQEKIESLEFKLQNLKSFRKDKIKEIDSLDTEINWIKIQLEELTNRKY
jgi:hypothetical protein